MKITVLVGFLFVVGCKHPAPVGSAPPPIVSASAASVASVEPPAASASAAPEGPKEHLLGGYTTVFKTNTHDGRVDNIVLAASKIDGLVIPPGEEVSFNQVVGPRTVERGFKNAPTIVMGEVFEGIGGGTCQVSSTLYTALLNSAVEVTDRRPHSRPSHYISPGLDATVSFPEECLKKADPTICYDLKFRNPFTFPISVHAGVEDRVPAKSGTERCLVVAIWGTGEHPNVQYEWHAWNTPPFEKRYRKVPYWKDDRKQLKQAGAPGLEGALMITTTFEDGHTIKKEVFSHYNPVPEVWEVGMEWKNPEP